MDYFKILPLEIKLDILTRLPTESALECKSVCTNRRSVVGHPSFSKIHFHHHLTHHLAAESGELGFLVLTRRRLHYFEYNQNHDQSKNPIQSITRINFTPPFKHFRFVGSINGLVCLLDNTYNRPRSVWICNPITRECLMLPEIKRDCDSDGYSYDETSFGYVSSTNEYKIVRFYELETSLEVHIYTLGSGDGWRNLGEFNYGSESLYLEHGVFFANETLYWLDDELEMIGTFDMAEEKFCQHLAPPPLPPDTNWILQYTNNLGGFDGFLFFALKDKVDGFNDIWLLKKKNHNPDKEEGEEHQSLGWRKEFRIDGMKSMDLLAVRKSDGVLTNSDDYINIYDTKTSTCKSLVKFWSCIAQVSPHKNTLVSFKELGEKDIKVMESAEIEETKSSEQLQEDADAEYIYL